MKTKFLLLALLVFSLFGVHHSWADVLPDRNGQIILSWMESSDVVTPSTGGTATLTVTGPTVGPSTIVNGYEGSTYGRTSGSSSLIDFGISFFSNSDVPEINPGGGV